MKKIILLLSTVLVVNSIFSQQINSKPVLTKQDYLKKSKTQKTVGWILAGAGAGMSVLAIATTDYDDLANVLQGDNSSINTKSAFLIIGGITAVSSIPFFISSGKNNRRAMTATTSLKFEKLPEHLPGNIQRNIYPALSININLK